MPQQPIIAWGLSYKPTKQKVLKECTEVILFLFCVFQCLMRFIYHFMSILKPNSGPKEIRQAS